MVNDVNSASEPSAQAEVLEAMQEHLLIAPLAVWLDVVRRSNCDDHLALLTWIIGQDECDLTIAQMVFYKCHPMLAVRRVVEPSAHLSALTAVCAEIVGRYEQGQYPVREVFTHANELSKPMITLHNYYRDLAAVDRMFDVPQAMLTAPTTAASDLCINWLPEGDPEIDRLYREAGLAMRKRTPAQAMQARENNSILMAFTDTLKRHGLATA